MAKENRDSRYDALDLVDKCLCHRYRYYVMNSQVCSDLEYDLFEKEAIKRGIPKNHLLSLPGSSNKTDYPRNIIKIAETLVHWYNIWYLDEKGREKYYGEERGKREEIPAAS